MAYHQAITHYNNHRKDRYFQQCSFSFSDTGVKSGAAIAEETAERFIVKNMATGDYLSDYYDTEDEAVDFFRQLEDASNVGIFTDKGLCIAR